MKADVELLNRRFGAPGRVVFRPGFAGYPNVVLANQYGAAEIALLGANVLSYRPTGQSEVLFRPAKRDYNRGDGVHCGVPVCWPQFGKCFSKDLPQHGFARHLVFDVRGTEYSEEITEVTLGLTSDDETKKLWDADFDLTYKVSVSMKLNLTLETRNTGTKPFGFSCGYHPYFNVRRRDDITVRGLDGAAFADARGADIVRGVQRGDIRMNDAYDHVFTFAAAPKHELALLDPGLRRAIAMVATGNDHAVVWNPGTAYVVDDHGPDDWQRFVCVEPVSDWPGGRTLAPGATHVLAVSIQSSLEENRV